MTGILKNFFDDPYDIYCDNGSWKTGFEDIGLDIGSVCVAEGNLTKVFIFLPINLNMFFWCSKENCFQLRTLIWRPAVNKQAIFSSISILRGKSLAIIYNGVFHRRSLKH